MSRGIELDEQARADAAGASDGDVANDVDDSAEPQMRRRIMDVAAQLFLDRGYEAASLREIATEVGVKAGSLYYHFASKDALLIAVFERGIEVVDTAFDQAAEAASGLPARERVSAHVRAHLSALFENGPYTAVHVTGFRTAPAGVRDAIVRVRNAYEQRWGALIDELQRAGDLRPDADLSLVRLGLLGALNFSVEWFDPSRGNLDHVAAELTAQFWNGVAA